MRLLVAAFLAVACGGAERPRDNAPPCERVADHLVRLAERDNQADADPKLAKGMKAEFDRQCRETPWSDERRKCLTAARSQDATLDCPKK